MPNHPTPLQIASVLARHAPKRIKHLLDPAVGSGGLLVPFIEAGWPIDRATVIDKRATVSRSLHRTVGMSFGSCFRFIVADYLQWVRDALDDGEQFDCILMNPPFSARKRHPIHLHQASGIDVTRLVPIEVAFVVQSLHVLQAGGRLLAVMPSSAISSGQTSWMREFLLNMGSVLLVHEIPKNSFKGIDGRIYLLVFEKGTLRKTVTLCNSDLFQPKKLSLSPNELGSEIRLDYSFQVATQADHLFQTTDRFNWSPLRKLADILRGPVESPIKGAHVLHTVDRNGPFWSNSSTLKIQKDKCKVVARGGDILMSRVGRNAFSTMGILTNAQRLQVSDCVHIVRPQKTIARNKLFLAMRIAGQMAHARGLLERGTGATYITQESLRALRVPIGICNIFRSAYAEYCKAIRLRSAASIENIERAILSKMSRSTL